MPKNKSMRIHLQAYKIQSFTDQEILSLIPEEELSRIKEKDSHPFFQVFSICHSGISRPKILGETKQTPIEWTKRAVQSLKNIVLRGVKAFIGHNKDSSTNNRKAVGQVVHSFEKEIDGVPHHLVIMYHAPKDKEIAKEFDICSQEGDWNLLDYGKKYVADTVNKITGIAFGKSSQDKPAFSGAIKLGMVQAFDNPGEPGENRDTGDVKMPLKFEEVKQAVRDLNIFPRQLFTEQDLKSDTEFSKFFEKLETVEKENKALKEENEKTKQEKEKLEKENQAATVKQRFGELVKEKKLTDQQREFMDIEFSSFTGDMDDKSLTKFIDDNLPKYKMYAEKGLFKKESSNAQSEMGHRETTNGDDYTKTDNNEFLKESYEEE